MILTLTAYGNSPCDSVSNSMVLIITPNPTVDPGNNDTICAGDNYTLSGSANNQSSTLWTTNGDGNFNNPTITNATYTPGPSDTINGSVILTLTAYGNNPCDSVSNSMVLSITPNPTGKYYLMKNIFQINLIQKLL